MPKNRKNLDDEEMKPVDLPEEEDLPTGDDELFDDEELDEEGEGLDDYEDEGDTF